MLLGAMDVGIPATSTTLFIAILVGNVTLSLQALILRLLSCR